MRSLVIWLIAMLATVAYTSIFVTVAWVGFIVGVAFGVIAWYVQDYTEWLK
jgi:hypothetical protein